RLEQGIARELGHEIAGEAADRAERGRAGASGTGASLVVVAVANHADAVALLECVVQEPFERAPGRVHLHAALESPVVSAFDIRVTPADMGDDHRVLPSKRAKQL